MFEERAFQKKIIEDIREAIRKGYKEILTVSPTGSGKTVIFCLIAKLAYDKGHRVLIGVHREKIVRQILKTLFDMGIQAGQIMSGRSLTKDMVQVGMVQTITKRLNVLKKNAFDIVIIDEGHHSVAKTYTDIIDYFTYKILLSFTATPLRLDNVGMGAIYKYMVQAPPTKWFVQQGLLKKFYVVGPPEEIKEDFHIKRGDFDKKEQQEAFTKKNIVGNVITHYRKYLNYKPAICFCVSKKHCDIMADVFIQAGYVAVAIYSGMKKEDEKKAYEGFENGSIHIITSCDKIGEGVDVPGIVGVILLRRTTSLALFLQWCGRGARPFESEPTNYILDHAGNSDIHGHPLDDREWSLHSKKINPLKTKPKPSTKCPECFGVFQGILKICPGEIAPGVICGFKFEEKKKVEKRKIPKVIEAELIEKLPKESQEVIKVLTNDIMRMENMAPKTRQKFLIKRAHELGNKDEVQALADMIGYKKGWTTYIFKNFVKKR